MSDITWKPVRVRLRDLTPWERNPRQMTRKAAERLLRGWQELGQVQTIAIGPGGEVYDGHQRLSALLAAYGEDYEVWALQSSRPLTEAERERLVLLLHAGAVGRWDWDALANWEPEVLLGGGLGESLRDVLEQDLRAIDELLASSSGKRDVEGERGIKDIADIPDTLPGMRRLDPAPRFDDLGAWDIPNLQRDMLASIPQPIDTWAGPDATQDDGETWWLYNWRSDSTRGLPFYRTVLAFYVDDRRFEGFWYQPDVYVAKVLNAGIPIAIAPNFSLWADAARATHLYNVFRSRWVARYMQEAGIRVIPDINWADERSFEFCLIGIPEEPPAVAVQLQTLRHEDEIASAVRGLSIALERLRPKQILVYGYRTAMTVVETVQPSCEVVFVENRVAKRRAVINQKRTEVLR